MYNVFAIVSMAIWSVLPVCRKWSPSRCRDGVKVLGKAASIVINTKPKGIKAICNVQRWSCIRLYYKE